MYNKTGHISDAVGASYTFGDQDKNQANNQRNTPSIMNVPTSPNERVSKLGRANYFLEPRSMMKSIH